MPADRVLSLAALTVLELSPPEMIRVAARCGYSHVGLRPIAATAEEREFPLLTDLALRTETIAALDDHGIGVLDIEIVRLRPRTDVAVFERALAFGAQVGARYVLVAGNDPDLKRTADRFGWLCELAASYGIRPHLEFMPWTDVPDLTAAMGVVERSGHGKGGVLVDAFHLDRSGGRASDIPRQDPRFGYVQLCDIAGPVPTHMQDILHEARAERLFPGEGDCDLAGLLDRLADDAPISLEVPRNTMRKAGVDAATRAQMALDATRSLLARTAAMAGD